MLPTFAEYDELIADFYWPRTRLVGAKALISLKTRAVLAGRYWGERGLPLGAAVLLNLGAQVEEALAREAGEEAETPSRVDRLRSAASCYALAGNWPQAQTILRRLPRTLVYSAAEVDLWERSEQNFALASQRLLQLTKAFARDDLDLSSAIALELVGRTPIRNLLWPLARHAMRLKSSYQTGRLTRLLVIGLPEDLVFHLSAAPYDPPEAGIEHARYVADAFSPHPYALAFAAYRLHKADSPAEAVKYAERSWSSVLRTSIDENFTEGQFAFCAMAVAVARRGSGDIGAAVQALETAASRTPDPDLRTYLAMLLVVEGQRARAEQRLKEAVAVERRSAWADLLLGTILLEADQPDRAARVFEARSGRLPERSRLLAAYWINYGVALALEGRLEDAVLAFREVRDAAPEYSAAQRNLERVRRRQPGALTIFPADHIAAAGSDEIVRSLVLAAA